VRVTTVSSRWAVISRSVGSFTGSRETQRIFCSRSAVSGCSNRIATIRPCSPSTCGIFGSGSVNPPRAHSGRTPRSIVPHEVALSPLSM
jgi:hypothetical protein